MNTTPYCKSHCQHFIYDETYDSQDDTEYESSTCYEGHQIDYDTPCTHCPDYSPRTHKEWWD